MENAPQGDSPGILKKLISRLTSATPDQARDTGMAMVLICLLFAYFGQRSRLLLLGIGLLVITMAWPRFFHPVAPLWFGLSHLLGTVVSRIVLTIVYFLLVVPVGLIRRWGGADSLQLKEWKKGQDSVFRRREGSVTPQDLEKPY